MTIQELESMSIRANVFGILTLLFTIYCSPSNYFESTFINFYAEMSHLYCTLLIIALFNVTFTLRYVFIGVPLFLVNTGHKPLFNQCSCRPSAPYVISELKP